MLAGVRRDEDAEALAAAGSDRLTPLIVDVTDSAAIDLFRERVETIAPEGIHGLVNNAGTAHVGPLEFIPVEDIRRQFEVNLIGQIAVTQAMIPSLRKTRGRIVNITSVGGLLATPFFGPYSASKFAFEAMSDCLRVELRPWGIETIAIEPGSIATEIWRERRGDLRRAAAAAAREGARALREGDAGNREGERRDRRPRHPRGEGGRGHRAGADREAAPGPLSDRP